MTRLVASVEAVEPVATRPVTRVDDDAARRADRQDGYQARDRRTARRRIVLGLAVAVVVCVWIIWAVVAR